MRWLLLLIIVLLLIWHFYPKPKPIPVEKTFIGEPIKAMHKAEDFNDQYLKDVKESQDKMEKQLEEETGGG